jgi:hypothetical protein
MKTADEILTEVMNDSPYNANFALSRPFILEAMEKYAALNQDSVSISLPDYEYEMLIDDEGTPFEINSWIPIATDRIKDLSRITEYIEKGLIRKRQ